MPALKNIFFAAFFTLIISQPALALWATQETGTTQNINAIYFVNAAVGYAVGNNGTVLATTNSGTTWEAKSTGDTGNYNNVFFPGLTEGYILSASGKVFKTTNGAATFSEVAGLSTSHNYKKGSYFGTYRVIIGTDNTNSILYTSTNEGTSWTAETISGIVASGVYLSATNEVWVWGTKDAKGIILKNGTIKYESSTSVSIPAINDLYFVDSNNGYAAGDDGWFYRTQNGGTGWTRQQITSVANKKLKSVFFTTVNLGWLVGAEGNVLTTGTGSAATPIWTSYPISGDVAATDTFNDISVYRDGSGAQTSAVGGGVGACGVMAADGTTYNLFAYLAGNSGKILKLASPTVTRITPNTKMQGWVGSVEVTGTGILYGAAVQFVKSGAPGIYTTTYTYPSNTKEVAYIVADRNTDTTTVYKYDVKIVNPDATYGTSSEAFTLNPYSAKVFFKNVWLNLHMVSSEVTGAGTTKRYNITTTPVVSYEISSTGTIEPNTMKAKLLTRLTTSDATTGGTTYVYSNIPGASIEVRATNEVHVFYTIPSSEALPAWSKGTDASFLLYGEDALGNIGIGQVSVAIAGDLSAGTTYEAFLGAKVGDPCYTGTIKSIIDRNVGETAFIRIPDKLQIYDFDIYISGSGGEQLAKWQVRDGKATLAPGRAGVSAMRVKKAAVAGQGETTQYAWFIPPEVFKDRPAGMYAILVKATDGRELARNKMMLWTNK